MLIILSFIVEKTLFRTFSTFTRVSREILLWYSVASFPAQYNFCLVELNREINNKIVKWWILYTLIHTIKCFNHLYYHLLQIDYHNLIFNRLVPCALRHYTVCTAGVQQHIHIAASNRNAELKYLRCVTDAILPYLLRTSEVQNTYVFVLL